MPEMIAQILLLRAENLQGTKKRLAVKALWNILSILSTVPRMSSKNAPKSLDETMRAMTSEKLVLLLAKLTVTEIRQKIRISRAWELPRHPNASPSRTVRRLRSDASAVVRESRRLLMAFREMETDPRQLTLAL